MPASNKRGGPGRGQGPRNLSGERGESPVMRFRAPQALHDKASALAEAAGVTRDEWLRRLIAKARK